MAAISAAPKKHLAYLDYLRVISAFAVIITHVSAQGMDSALVMSPSWIVSFVYNCAARTPVPMFLMISGALFLDPDRPLDIRKLFTNNIFRLVTAWFFWSAVYALDTYLLNHNVRTAFQDFLWGHYHMWYLFMILGFYLLTPVYRKITESRQVLSYFLGILFLVMLFFPSLFSLLKYINLPHTATLRRTLEKYLSLIKMGFVPAFAFYYFMGSYLAQFDIGRKKRTLSYVLGITAYLYVLFGSLHSIANTGDVSVPLDFVAADALMCCGLFLFVKYDLPLVRAKSQGLITNWAKNAFGIYLAHALVLSKLTGCLGLTPLSFSPILSIPVISIAVFFLSWLISAVLHRIPVLKKYVV